MKYIIYINGIKKTKLLDESKRTEFECHIMYGKQSDLCLWCGCDRGNYYFGLSNRNENNVLTEISRFAHITKSKFIELLTLPLNWKCIIDCELSISKNNAPFGWDYKNSKWINIPIELKNLSKR